jgi:hypothetical protein
MNAMKKVLENYRDDLEKGELTDDIWKNFVCKMKVIKQNCQSNDLGGKNFNDYCNFKNEVIFYVKKLILVILKRVKLI